MVSLAILVNDVLYMWKLIDSGKKEAQANMDYDAYLLENLDPDGLPLLHFYDWSRPSFTHGYFIDPNKFLNLEAVKKRNIDFAKRPTGGGIIFHLTDLAFSALVPSNCSLFSENTLKNYAQINDRVVLAVQQVLKEGKVDLLKQEPIEPNLALANFCMAKPTIYDVMLQGKKIAGAAQRKRKQGFLHQGTISITLPNEAFLKEVLPSESNVLFAMKTHTLSLLEHGWTEDTLTQMRQRLKEALKNIFLKD